MKIVYFGSGEFGIDSLDALIGAGKTPEFIVTQPSKPAGRGRKTKPTAVASWAMENSVSFIETANVNSNEIYKKLVLLEPDLILVIAFGQKISNEIISLPEKGIINVHSSLLPKYRGAAPINWAIINGEAKTGVSVITVVDKMDAGDILSQAKTEILDTETAGQLHERLAKLAAPLLVETIAGIENDSANYVRQDSSKATAAPKLKKSDGFLDFNESAEILTRKIRGLWPWPAAAAIYQPQKTNKDLQIIIAEAEPIENLDTNPKNLSVGSLDENLNVICGSGAIEIMKIKPAGKKVMTFAEFANGRHCQPGDKFVKIDR
ncbi:MAG: methionyl-tRNA formyltransferase [Planctomycetes bacterium]|nr:methionyl-tRNA formyltransferase [Planctomycetota bacterium]